ncbi:MAG TPA: hypothetical protein EYH00_01630 [Archaeoglobus profundus]|nr:hypothetical protein [Archaeoglobus profundus]
MKHYKASFIFAVGLGLIVLGLCMIVIFQLHYGSDPNKVKITFLTIGISIPIVIHGINMMLGYGQHLRILTISGFLLCVIALISFLMLYPENWFYPNVTYTITIYALGLIILLSSSFAEAINKFIESRKSRDIDVINVTTTKKNTFLTPAKFEEPELEVADIKIDFKPGKSLEYERIGRVTRIRDKIDLEAEKLIRVSKGELKVKRTDEDIEEVTKALKSIEEKMSKTDKKKIFGG